MSHNAEVKSLVNELKRDLGQANSREQLYAMVNKVITFGKPLEYNNGVQYGAGIASLMIAIIVSIFLFTGRNTNYVKSRFVPFLLI